MTTAPDTYFKNRVAMMGKVISLKDEAEFQTLQLETREVCVDGESKCETHEVRYYKNDRHVPLDASVVGLLMEVNGRIRIKDSGCMDYRPFIHCLDFQLRNS